MYYCDDCMPDWPKVKQEHRSLRQCDVCGVEKSVHDTDYWTDHDVERIALLSSGIVTGKRKTTEMDLISNMLEMWGDMANRSSKKPIEKCQRCKGIWNVGTVRRYSYEAQICLRCNQQWEQMSATHPNMTEWHIKLATVGSQIDANIRVGNQQEHIYMELHRKKMQIMQAMVNIYLEWIGEQGEQ